jgi:N6-adenosine-specific RNA methylase IME4/ParB-like chromosome segregation protein Spo0J
MPTKQKHAPKEAPCRHEKALGQNDYCCWECFASMGVPDERASRRREEDGLWAPMEGKYVADRNFDVSVPWEELVGEDDISPRWTWQVVDLGDHRGSWSVSVERLFELKKLIHAGMFTRAASSTRANPQWETGERTIHSNIDADYSDYDEVSQFVYRAIRKTVLTWEIDTATEPSPPMPQHHAPQSPQKGTRMTATIKETPIASIKVQERFRRDLGDIPALAASIKEHGLLHPIVVTSDHVLIVGQRRLLACESLGWVSIPAHVIDLDNPVGAELDENDKRMDFRPSERVAIAKALDDHERKKAKERQSKAGPQEGRGKKKSGSTGSGNFPEAVESQPQVRDLIGARVGWSGKTYEKAKMVVEAAKDDPVRFAPVAQKMDQTGKVDGAYRKVQQAKQVDQLRARETTPAAFDGLYDVLVIDPPWPVAIQGREERPDQLGLDYVPMTLEQIRALTLPMAEACHVWLWTTHHFMPEAVKCLAAWGLTYVCCFIWHKPGGMQPMYLPQFNCELSLYARKGAPVFAETSGFFTCFQAPRQKHSAKPEAFYALVRRVTAGRRLDMFNRRVIAGFDGWGNETTEKG